VYADEKAGLELIWFGGNAWRYLSIEIPSINWHSRGRFSMPPRASFSVRMSSFEAYFQVGQYGILQVTLYASSAAPSSSAIRDFLVARISRRCVFQVFFFGGSGRSGLPGDKHRRAS
jgi:hypothetical protein